MTRDILATPGVSVTVERLSSSCRRTMTEERGSLTPDSACKTVISKEWLKAGLGKGLNYLNGIAIHGRK
jgi:hypothetical protein